jgi:hypothetical protein
LQSSKHKDEVSRQYQSSFPSIAASIGGCLQTVKGLTLAGKANERVLLLSKDASIGNDMEESSMETIENPDIQP